MNEEKKDLEEQKNEPSEAAANETKRYLKPREIAAYCLTSYGQNNLTTFINASKQYFMMNFLGISGSAFGAMNTVSSVWDALDDPISGIVIDRFRTRWGRLRPFLIFPIPLWAITSIMFFMVPGIESDTAKFFYATIVTIINGIGWSYFNGWNLLLYNITPSTNERSTLIASQKFVNLFTYLPSLVPLFVDFIPKISNNKVNQESVYSSWSMIFVIFAIGCAIFGFFNMRERVPLASREEMKETSIWQSIKLVVKNPPLFVLLLSNFFGQVKGVGGASEDFFWLNCTGRLSNKFLCSLFTGLPNYVTTPLAPKLIKRFGTRRTAVACGIFGGCGYLLLYIVGYAPTGNYWLNFVIITVLLTIAGLPNHIMGVCDPLLTGDMYDYLEWKTGLRSEGLVNAVHGYVGKLSGSVIGLLSGVVFDWISFTPQKDVYGNIVPHTNMKVLQGIFGIFCLAPAVARFGYGLSLLLFSVHGKFKEDMLKDLAQRRIEKAGGESA